MIPRNLGQTPDSIPNPLKPAKQILPLLSFYPPYPVHQPQWINIVETPRPCPEFPSTTPFPGPEPDIFNSDIVSEFGADCRFGIIDKCRTVDDNERLFYCHLFSCLFAVLCVYIVLGDIYQLYNINLV